MRSSFKLIVLLLPIQLAAAAQPEPLTGMQFVTIPAGCFSMGRDTPRAPSVGETFDRLKVEILIAKDELPEHQVCVEPFELAQHEVTQLQWQQVMPGAEPTDPNWPALRISWQQARLFARKLTEQANDGYLYRLPTEAEWEFACAGGKTWSHEVPDQGLQKKVAHFWKPQPIAVGSLEPNNFGLYDMQGNAWEWTSSDYLPYTEAQHWHYHPNTDLSIQKVLRGGSHRSIPDNISCARRGHSWGDEQLPTVGFRLAREPRI